MIIIAPKIIKAVEATEYFIIYRKKEKQIKF